LYEAKLETIVPSAKTVFGPTIPFTVGTEFNSSSRTSSLISGTNSSGSHSSINSSISY
jgi:hypothetical protein